MQFPDSFFEDEVRNGFYVPALMKRSWAAQMEVLSDIAEVCSRHQIRWFAACGTLLGAVRHGGFIPWDDDLDIWMLREDYNRFNAIAEKELPQGYRIPRDREGCLRLFTIVWYGNGICLDEEHLKKLHGFPFAAGIDIFPLDYLPPDFESREIQKNMILAAWTAASSITPENQDTEASKALISQVEKLFQIHLDRQVSITDQMLNLLETIFMSCNADNTSEITDMINWVNNNQYRFPPACYQDSLLLPFETTEIPVPVLYDDVLKIHFGEGYMTPAHWGGAHNYPHYQEFEKFLTDLTRNGSRLLPSYQFSKNDLGKTAFEGTLTRPWNQMKKFLLLAHRIHDSLVNVLTLGDSDSARKLLEASQNGAIRIGSMLEQSEKEGSAVIALLEEYCELVYQIHEKLPIVNTDDVNNSFRSLEKLRFQMETTAQKQIQAKKEIVFLPYKASAWNSLEPAWRAAIADPDCRVYVIPIPYYYKDIYGNLQNMQYDGDHYPDYVPITAYDSYDFENRRPDAIFIHNPYDDCNLTTSVPPFFYSGNLKQYTDCLVYIPYFLLDEIDPGDAKSSYNMRYYVSVPGLVHADKILVQSGQMRQTYIEYLTTFAGCDTEAVWNEKIKVTPFLQKEACEDLI